MSAIKEKENTLEFHRKKVLGIIKDKTLSHEQTMLCLSSAGRDILETPGDTEKYYDMKENGWICDLNEGHVTYCPRYILPDYSVFMENGSEFLRLEAPTNLYEATMNLLVLYHHTPSVTHFPVYIGRIDQLLEPFVLKETEARGEDAAYTIIKGFLKQIDRTVTDSFCHGNIGPEDTKTGRLVLRAERELQNSTPNLTLLYDPEITSDEFATLCVECALDCAKPSFADHKLFSEELGAKYGIASCYNGLPVGGGAFTLTRLILSKIARGSQNKEDFMNFKLPEAIDTMCQFMDTKIKFIVEETPFFESNFLVKEGLLDKDRFVGLFGMVGMCECVNTIMEKEGKEYKYGYDVQADNLGVEIMEFIQDRVNKHQAPYSPVWNNRFMLHAQVGIDSDTGTSPGTRIAIGQELPLYEHIRHASLFHKYFPSGTGDIFPFDSTSASNPQAILDVFKGAFACGMRYISTYTGDSDVIRITGYLVKKSDIAKLESQQAVINDTVVLGMGAAHNSKILERKVRNLSE